MGPLGSPGSVPIESMITRTQKYSPHENKLGLESVYPVVQGYKDVVAYGVHARFRSGSAQWLGVTATYSPHLCRCRSANARHVPRTIAGSTGTRTRRGTTPDFYDLFGPTRTSRRGLRSRCRSTQAFCCSTNRADSRSTSMDASPEHLDQLPEYQNVAGAGRALVLAWSATCRTATCARRSANVDDEKGQRWSLGHAQRRRDLVAVYQGRMARSTSG
jgi:hypothetical protein